MNDETQIRFGLALPKNKPFVDAVLDSFSELEEIRRREYESYKAELKLLRTENQNYRQAYHDQWYNDREIERCWSVIGNYNRKHLELHEAIREYIRNHEWDYERADAEASRQKTIQEYAEILAMDLALPVTLTTKLVIGGISSVNAMTGVEVRDLTDPSFGFSQAEAELIVANFDRKNK